MQYKNIWFSEQKGTSLVHKYASGSGDDSILEQRADNLLEKKKGN